MAMSVVPGKNISALMERLGSPNMIEGSVRQAAIEDLTIAYQQLGKFMAELHNKQANLALKPSSTYISKEINKLSQLVSQFAEHFSIDSNLIKRYCDNFKKNPGVASYVHGDIHPFYFMLNLGKLGAIDLNSLSRSIGLKGQGVGVATKDFLGALYALDRFGAFANLQQKEIDLFKKVLTDTYTHEFASMHTQEAKEFYRLYGALHNLSKLKLSGRQDLLDRFIEIFKKDFLN